MKADYDMGEIRSEEVRISMNADRYLAMKEALAESNFVRGGTAGQVGLIEIFCKFMDDCVPRELIEKAAETDLPRETIPSLARVLDRLAPKVTVFVPRKPPEETL